MCILHDRDRDALPPLTCTASKIIIAFRFQTQILKFSNRTSLEKMTALLQGKIHIKMCVSMYMYQHFLEVRHIPTPTKPSKPSPTPIPNAVTSNLLLRISLMLLLLVFLLLIALFLMYDHYDYFY